MNFNFAPSVVGGGTLQFGYAYTDNAGDAKTGTVSIPYAATAHDVVTGTASPSGQIAAIVNSGTQTVNVTFNTDDGNVATGLTVLSPFSSLPNDWHTAGHDEADYDIQVCAVAADGSISNCQATGSNFSGAEQLVVQGSRLYIANEDGSSPPVTYCSIDSSTGQLSGCTTTGASSAEGTQGNYALAFFGSFAYEQNDQNGHVVECSVANDGSFNNCVDTGVSGYGSSHYSVANQNLYVPQYGGSVSVCPINNDGSLGTCTPSQLGSFTFVPSVNVVGSVAYVAEITDSTNNGIPQNSSHVYVCAVNPTSGALSGCTQSDGGITYDAVEGTVVH